MLTDLGDAPLPDVMGISDRPSLEAMVLASLGRAHFQAGSIGPARESGSSGRWLTAGGGLLDLEKSMAWARWPCSKPGRAGPNAPRTWPAKPWRRLET